MSFHTGLCHCYKDPGTCFHTWCCFCFSVGTVQDQMDRKSPEGWRAWWPCSRTCWGAFALLGCAPCFMPCCCSWPQRRQFMKENRVKGQGECVEALKACFCMACSTCQLRRELASTVADQPVKTAGIDSYEVQEDNLSDISMLCLEGVDYDLDMILAAAERHHIKAEFLTKFEGTALETDKALVDRANLTLPLVTCGHVILDGVDRYTSMVRLRVPTAMVRDITPDELQRCRVK